MKGFPKWLNTRADVELCLQEFPTQMKAKIQEWLDNRYCWQPVEQITGDGIEDDIHKIEVREDGTKWQLAYIEDPNCTLFRLGLTVEEAQAMVA